MGKLILDISISLDGFVAGPNPTLEEPLGEGGGWLHEWAFATKAFRERHGLADGEANVDSKLVSFTRRKPCASANACQMIRRS